MGADGFAHSKQLALNFYEHYYDERAEKYFAEETEGRFFFQDGIQKPFMDQYLSSIRFSSVLDLGCGTGYYSKIFEKMGKSVLAIDVSQKMIDLATSQCESVEFRRSEFLDEFNSDRRFDLIFASMMIGYFEDLEKLMLKAKSLINRRGRIVLTGLHPIRTSSTRKNYQHYVCEGYLNQSLYSSDFLDDEYSLPLYTFTFSDFTRAARSANLEIEFFEPSATVRTEYCSTEEFNFYSNNPSIVVISLRGK